MTWMGRVLEYVCSWEMGVTWTWGGFKKSWGNECDMDLRGFKSSREMGVFRLVSEMSRVEHR